MLFWVLTTLTHDMRDFLVTAQLLNDSVATDDVFEELCQVGICSGVSVIVWVKIMWLKDDVVRSLLEREDWYSLLLITLCFPNEVLVTPSVAKVG